MRCHRLPNYLRTFRKRSGFSQDEVAFLLGCRSGAKICRYEQFRRTPRLKTLFAYEVIFQKHPSELFSGEFQEVERRVRERAERLVAHLLADNQGQLTKRKLVTLQLIVSPNGNHP